MMTDQQHERPVDAIKVSRRFRKDLGQIRPLADSINRVGLLHPPVVNQDNELIAGSRRLAAVKMLGWSTVPVTVVPLDEIVRGEFAENAFRKPLTRSEQVAIKKALERVERQEAKKRQARSGKPRSAKVGPDEQSGRTRDRVAKALGTSAETIRKAEAVVAAAEAAPETFGPLKDQMDETGRVDPAYRAMESKIRRLQPRGALLPPAMSGPARTGSDSVSRIRSALATLATLLADTPLAFIESERDVTVNVLQGFQELLDLCTCTVNCEHKQAFEGTVRHALTVYTAVVEAEARSTAADDSDSAEGHPDNDGE